MRSRSYGMVYLVLLLVVCGTDAGAATVLYQTGFEPPAYTAGALKGQGGWTGSGLPVVQTAIARTGTHAVSVPASGPLFSLADRPVVYSPSSSGETIVRVSLDMRLSANSSTAWTAIGVSGTAGFIAQLNVADGFAYLGLASSSVGPVAVAAGVWNTFVVELNHGAQTVSASVNGVPIGIGAITAAPNVFNLVRFGLVDGGQPADVAYYDNLAVVSRPRGDEPLTFTTFVGPSGGRGSEDGVGSAARFNNPSAVVMAADGSLFIADYSNAIRKVTPAGAVSTFAGRSGISGNVDGKGSNARLGRIASMAIGGDGTIYAADSVMHTIRRISPDGTVATIAGKGGVAGHADGMSAAARFSAPNGIALAGNGDLYVADSANSAIRKITSDGSVTTFAGTPGASGSTDGPVGVAKFDYPRGLAFAANGTLYVADHFNATIRAISTSGAVSTVAGSARSRGIADGSGSVARFRTPTTIVIDAAGDLYVSDRGGQTVRKVTPLGTVTTAAGVALTRGSTDGPAASARFSFPHGLAIGPSGSVYVTDWDNHTIRVISGGIVTTFLGTAAPEGASDGPAATATFGRPAGLASDAAGNLYVADSYNHTIRKIEPSGNVSTFAGSAGAHGSDDGPAAQARFSYPENLAFDSKGNLFVVDRDNYTIRKIDPSGSVTTFAGSAGQRGSVDGTGPVARFNVPTGIAIDAQDNLFVSDWTMIRRVTSGGIVTTFAGGAEAGSNDGPARDARFSSAEGLAFGPDGALYAADVGNHTIRRVSPGGVVSTFAGTAGTRGHADGAASAALFASPWSMAADRWGNLYVGDVGNNNVRRIAPDGTVTSLSAALLHDPNAPGTGLHAELGLIDGMVIDRNGRLFASNSSNRVIRVGRDSLPDAAAIDAPFAPVGSSRLLSVANDTDAQLEWRLIRWPSGSTATLSSSTARTPTFTPDVRGFYVFRLTATRDGVASITTVVLEAADQRRRGVRK
jgi:sugar lactone lactonase YvrE